jgi:hypothetical protein
MTGFGKDPANPFTNIRNDGNLMYSPGTRQPPLFEFNPSRLFLDPNNVANVALATTAALMPGYFDSYGNPPPTAASTTYNFYAYFTGYGNGVYDANDVNFVTEADNSGVSPLGLQFQQSGAFYTSPVPNPYTSSLTVAATGTVGFQKPQSFQIISAGVDGLYGVGGQYIQNSATNTSTTDTLPPDLNNTFVGAAAPPLNEADATIRRRERDNVTNFKSGTLQ